MATLDEMNTKMTVFYYKSNGDIYSLCTGIQELNVFFGSHSTDLALILDSVVLDKDMNVMNSPKDFKVNTASKTLEVLASAINTSYPIAST
ncbi:hypothetical protein [Clostridium pasteurianum]|uniref:Uncharacterized protein n=1 Tax=Clostridium pasteurianum BC1 TaxID=86416 RepID=R4K4R6_CLOPA|nr:hypothetical protein [Clostridium pasteurianum]AGK98157.1 hypothetical protein Clopa_3361 [Clostridium pasteurianum BC1]